MKWTVRYKAEGEYTVTVEALTEALARQAFEAGDWAGDAHEVLCNVTELVKITKEEND